MNQTTPPTIPHIAEILRTYIKSSNDAPRLIVEHILPVIGGNVDNVDEVQDAPDRQTLIDNTHVRLTRLASIADHQRAAAEEAYEQTDDVSTGDALIDSANTFRKLMDALEEISEELENA